MNILIAGMPRSGSTWQFNVVRLILGDSGIDFEAGWIGDLEVEAGKGVRLVKLHNLMPELPEPAFVFTTWRPLDECVWSRVRMGWVPAERLAVRQAFKTQQVLYVKGHEKSDFETSYTDILHGSEAEITRIDDALCSLLNCRRDPGRAARIQGKMAHVAPPDRKIPGSKAGYDPLTLLHPGHRAPSPSYRDVSIQADWLEGLEQQRLQPRNRS